mmetsp:Transcript_12938/g.44160  ORF Transcript_12938/g.44160 Transcript_12938/m.44160 type:complete len:239 (+) Transcript_12938:3246-3962(+)
MGVCRDVPGLVAFVAYVIRLRTRRPSVGALRPVCVRRNGRRVGAVPAKARSDALRVLLRVGGGVPALVAHACAHDVLDDELDVAAVAAALGPVELEPERESDARAHHHDVVEFDALRHGRQALHGFLGVLRVLICKLKAPPRVERRAEADQGLGTSHRRRRIDVDVVAVAVVGLAVPSHGNVHLGDVGLQRHPVELEDDLVVLDPLALHPHARREPPGRLPEALDDALVRDAGQRLKW